MYFKDRVDAGRQLAELIAQQLTDDPSAPQGPAPVILGLPRGGVPVAREVATRLAAPLDIILVRKLGVPAQPELGFGAIGEDGVRVLSAEIMRATGVTEYEASHIEAKARKELDQRTEMFRSVSTPIPLTGRTAVIVDDGLATGSTAIAACQVARAHGATRVVLAVAVAPPDWVLRCGAAADQLIAVATPVGFSSVGQWYGDYSPTSDDEVIDILRLTRREDDMANPDPIEVHIPWGNAGLVGDLLLPQDPQGVVVFAHGTGSSRHSPRNRIVADHLYSARIASVLIDLVPLDETGSEQTVSEQTVPGVKEDRLDLLAQRVGAAVEWVGQHPKLSALKIGVCGASTGAAVALFAAAQPHSPIAAVVSRGGRPDLAREVLSEVKAPTLLIVGSRDHQVLNLNTEAGALMNCEKELVVIPGATHLFEESGTLVEAAHAATAWFVRYLAP
jgi:putative phosphoribosyl transferase